MEHPSAVGVVGRPGQLLHQRGRLVRWQGRARQPPGQAAAAGELHHQVGPAGVLAYLVDLDDVGVLQARHGLGLDAEPLARLRQCARPGRDHLQGHHAAQAVLPGAIDHGHATPAQEVEDFVARYLG